MHELTLLKPKLIAKATRLTKSAKSIYFLRDRLSSQTVAVQYWLLHSQQNLAVLPQFFKVIVFALVGGEQMHHHVAVVHHHPTIAGLALFPAFLAMFRADSIQRAVGQRVQHAVTGAVAEYKIIGKGRYVFYIKQEDVFTFFVFKRINNGVSKFKCVQKSPRNRNRYCVRGRWGQLRLQAQQHGSRLYTLSSLPEEAP